MILRIFCVMRILGTFPGVPHDPPPVPDHEKRQNVGLRLHPITIERLDEIAAFFKKLREFNPLLPFRYPESRTEVIEWMLREGTLDVLRRVQVWSRLGTSEMKPNDMDFMASSHFWNMLLTEVRRMHMRPFLSPG